MNDRVKKSLTNVKVGLFFYIASLLLSFVARKVFLDFLGAEFLGVWGVLNNIMNYLNVAELGISTSITFFLYKPIQQNDHKGINEMTSILAFLYRCIGIAICAIGVVVSLFFPLFFNDLTISLPLIYFSFYSLLFYASVGYIFNYRQLLLSASQKQYVVNGYIQTIGIVQSLFQILLAFITQNLYLWVSVTIFSTIIGSLLLNRRISREYPWLKTNLKEGYQKLKQYPEILKKTGQVFLQKIKNLILYRSDEIMVAVFGGVVMSAFYVNYTMLVNKVNFMVNILSDGMNAGVGNLVAEGDKRHTMKVFWELTAIRFLIVGIIIFGFLMLIQPFIVCWLGREYLLSDLIVYLLLFNVFITLSRGVVEMYIAAHGLYQDVWATWAELLVNLGVTLCLAPFYGIVGILLGKILSVFFIAVFWKPYYLFTKGLQVPVHDYWKGMMPYYALFIVFTALAIGLKYYLVEPHVDNFLQLIIYGAAAVIPLMTLYLISLLYLTQGMKDLFFRKPALYNKLKKLHLLE